MSVLYSAGAGRVPQRTLLQPVSARFSLRRRLAKRWTRRSSCMDSLACAESEDEGHGRLTAACPHRRSAHHGLADQPVREHARRTTSVASISFGFSKPFPSAGKRPGIARNFSTCLFAQQCRHFSSRDDRKHRSCCSAWPLDESENYEHLASGSPSVFPRLNVSEKHRILGLYEKGHNIIRYATELLQNCTDNNLWPSLFARPPTHRLPKHTPPAPSRDSLLGFRDHGTASQSRPLPSRRSGDLTCRAASVASRSDFEGWELTDTA